MKKIIIQGYPGSFHDLTSSIYFGADQYDPLVADTFEILGRSLRNNLSLDYAVMAIENNIAGTILENYRILREYDLNIIGEVYLRIEQNLMALPGQCISEIQEVHSHPMALRQSRPFLNKHSHLKVVESIDTALSARKIAQNNLKGIAAIASRRAAEIYKLNIIADSIETHKSNYTRFFILSRDNVAVENYDKASLWMVAPLLQGSLASALNVIQAHDINLSKLQSFPIMGRYKQYYFHLDLEFDQVEKYKACLTELKKTVDEIKVLGEYNKHKLVPARKNESTIAANANA